jgi:hypothetical protein
MTKYDMVVQMLMRRLEQQRAGIEDDNIEQLGLDMRFRPHGGPPRSLKVQILHAAPGADTPVNGVQPSASRT